MQYITLERLKEYTKEQEEKGFRRKEILCEDCWREMKKDEISWCNQNHNSIMYCRRCQKNHSTTKSNKAYIDAYWNMSFHWKYFKWINREKNEDIINNY